MFLSLTVCINQPDNFNQFASRSDETIRALKERICHKFNLNPMTLDLRTLQEGRDLNKDEMLVGHLGITNDTIIMAYVGKQSAPPQVSKNSFMRQQQPASTTLVLQSNPATQTKPWCSILHHKSTISRCLFSIMITLAFSK